MAAKVTTFNTRFWQDTYVADLDPTEKLVFMYALTSPYLSLCGVYEVPIKYISVETGIERDMLVKIFARFERDNKIIYKDGWLCVLNYPKYQSYNLPMVKVGLKNEINAIPLKLLTYLKEHGYYWQGIANALAIDCQPDTDKDTDKDTGKDTGKDTPPKRNGPKRNNSTEKPTSSIEYIRALPADAVIELAKLYDVRPAFVQDRATDLILYCEAKGKTYKNYWAALQTWVRRDAKTARGSPERQEKRGAHAIPL